MREGRWEYEDEYSKILVDGWVYEDEIKRMNIWLRVGYE